MIGLPRAAAASAKRAQRLRVAHGLEEQHVAVDVGIIERRRADLAEREVDLVADRDQAGKADAARLAAREQRADHAAGVRGGEDAADRQVRLVERGVGGKHRLVAQVDDAEARRPDDADAGVLQQISPNRASRAAPSSPASAKPSASTVATFTPSRPHSSTASIAASVGVTI